MSSAVQLKLLTLLNVSAIKRPFDLDVPGGHRSSPTLSRETSLTPQQPPQPSSIEVNGSSSSSSRGADGEPPKKKKKGVIFGGVIGPSGSTIKDGEASKSGSGEKKSKKNKKSEKAVEVDAEAPAASVSAEASTSAFALEPESDSSSDEAETTTSKSTTTPSSTSDAFTSHFSINPPILTEPTREAAEAHEWMSRRRVLGGLGRVVECLPKGFTEDVEGEGAGSSRVSIWKLSPLGKALPADKFPLLPRHRIISQITPSLLPTYKSNSPNPTDLENAALRTMGGYKDMYLHGIERDEDVEGVRGAAMLHAVNHVLK
jgi:U3 small nucleolar RNA-associated protein 25